MFSFFSMGNFLRTGVKPDFHNTKSLNKVDYISLPRRNTFDRLIDYCEDPQITLKEFSKDDQVEFSRFLYGNRLTVITKQPSFNK